MTVQFPVSLVSTPILSVRYHDRSYAAMLFIQMVFLAVIFFIICRQSDSGCLIKKMLVYTIGM